MPTGPTMSGPAPEPIWVARASFAPAYGTASNVRWILSWDALKSSTTFFSTATCSGASPPPRQQYQRMSTWPGAAVPPVRKVVGAADSPGDPSAPETGEPLAVDEPHAPITRATTATRANARNGFDRMALLAVVPARGWLGTSRCRVITASSPTASGGGTKLSPACAGQPADAGTRARLLHRGG